MDSNYSTTVLGSIDDVVCARVGGAKTTLLSFLNFLAAHFAKRNLNCGGKSEGEADGILAWHPDRLARNSVDGGQIIYLIDCGRIVALKFPQF